MTTVAEKRIFVLISGMGRSGTTLLQKSLLHHPKVKGPTFEVTDALFAQGIGLVTHDVSECYVQASMGDFVNFLVGREYGSEEGMIGVLKHTSNSFYGTKITIDRTLSWIPHSKVIFIQRKDPLEKLASHLCAVRGGTWHISGDNSLPEEYYRPLSIPLWMFRRYAADHIRIMQFYERLQSHDDVLCLDYDAIEERGLHDVLKAAFDFLDIGENATSEVSPPLRKMAPPVETYVKNHKILRREFGKMEVCFAKYGYPLPRHKVVSVNTAARMNGWIFRLKNHLYSLKTV